MRTLRSFVVASALAVVGTTALLYSGDAEACGACFHQQGPMSNTVVTGHRMVLSISTTQTVLWDQIQYQGDPAEFAWVLPVKPGARIEPGTAAFFELLESYTARDIQPAPLYCGGGGPSIGCAFAHADAAYGGDTAGAGGGADAPHPSVSVVHEGTVGPYETVTLHTSTPGALDTWLDSHGYAVDPGSQPIIDEYVAEGFDFIALRLQPGQGTTAMTPVRVISPGASPTLPLRMVAIGTGATVPIVLHIIGEGRWTVQNFPEAKLQTELLAWDFKSQSSNYAQLRTEALKNGSWLTAFSGQNFFAQQTYVASNGQFGTTGSFAEAYKYQAMKDLETPTLCPMGHPAPTGVVVNPCPAGVPLDSPKCGTVAANEVDARELGCPGADDVAVALTGMHYENVWDTRLEAELPHDALKVDMNIQAAPSQTAVPQVLTAAIAENAGNVCGTTIVLPSMKPNGRGSSLPPLLAAFFGMVSVGLVARRMRTRTATA